MLLKICISVFKIHFQKKKKKKMAQEVLVENILNILYIIYLKYIYYYIFAVCFIYLNIGKYMLFREM